MQSASDISPVRPALHQSGEGVVCLPIIFESLGPKMAGISHHHLSSTQKQRMIVGRPRRETRFDRYRPGGSADCVYFAATGKTETAFARRGEVDAVSAA